MKLNYAEIESLGFNEKKAKVYLTVLESGGTAAEIAQRSKLKRTTVYGYLNELIQDQLISQSIRGSRRFFVAEPPSQLTSWLETRRQVLNNIMPELRSLFLRGSSNLPHIRYFEGIEGIRKIHEELLATRGHEYFYFGSQKSFTTGLGQEYLSDFTRRRIRRKIWSNALRIRGGETNDPDTLGSKENLRRVRYLPKPLFPHLASISMVDDKVIIISEHPFNHAFIIQDKALYNIMKLVWDFCWEHAEE